MQPQRADRRIRQVSSTAVAVVFPEKEERLDDVKTGPTRASAREESARGKRRRSVAVGEVTSSLVEVRCPPPSMTHSPSHPVRRISHEDEGNNGLEDSASTASSATEEENEETHEEGHLNSQRPSNDGEGSKDALAIMAAVAMTELVDWKGTIEQHLFENKKMGGNESSNIPSSAAITMQTQDEEEQASRTQVEESPRPFTPEPQHHKKQVGGRGTHRQKRMSTSEDEIRLPFKKRRSPSSCITAVVELGKDKKMDHGTSKQDDDAVERMTSSMNLESRNPSPIGPTKNNYYTRYNRCFISSQSPDARTTPARPEEYSHLGTAPTTSPPSLPLVQATQQGHVYYNSHGQPHSTPPPPYSPYPVSSSPKTFPGYNTAPACSFVRVSPHQQHVAPASFSHPSTLATSANGGGGASHNNKTAGANSYEEIVRSCGLPKSLSFRKICSKCGKTRSEHGELGFGNKCVFQECGKCQAGVHVHRKAGQPMGILCQLTVLEGAKPGAVSSYERKIRELAARAEVQKEIQRMNKKKKQDARRPPEENSGTTIAPSVTADQPVVEAVGMIETC